MDKERRLIVRAVGSRVGRGKIISCHAYLSSIVGGKNGWDGQCFLSRKGSCP